MNSSPSNNLTTGFRLERDVAYLPADRTEKADLYAPLNIPGGKRVPAVVIIHGGGFTGGVRDAARELNIGGNLARHGFVALSIDYALATADRPSWPQNLHDCKTAVRWLRVNAEHLQIDPDHIGVIGGSAGGTLAALLTLTHASDGLDPSGLWSDISCAVQCGVNLYGVTDIADWRKDTPMLGQTFAEAPELYRQASPITYVRADVPPLLTLHGTADELVDVKQSQQLVAALRQTGTEHDLSIVPDASHGFHLEPPQGDLRPLVLGFLDRHLKPAHPDKSHGID